MHCGDNFSKGKESYGDITFTDVTAASFMFLRMFLVLIDVGICDKMAVCKEVKRVYLEKE